MRDHVLTRLSRFDFYTVLELGLLDPLLTAFNQFLPLCKHLLRPQLLSPDLISDLLFLRFFLLNLLQQLV